MLNMYVDVSVHSHVCVFVHECARECVWIITCLQGRLPADPQIQALSLPKRPPRESDERASERGRKRGEWRTEGERRHQERRMRFDERQTRNTGGENERGRRLIERTESTSGLELVLIDESLLDRFLLACALSRIQGETENISETMFPLAKSNDKNILCSFSVRYKHTPHRLQLNTHTGMCCVLPQLHFRDNVWKTKVAEVTGVCFFNRTEAANASSEVWFRGNFLKPTMPHLHLLHLCRDWSAERRRVWTSLFGSTISVTFYINHQIPHYKCFPGETVQIYVLLFPNSNGWHFACHTATLKSDNTSHELGFSGA